MIIMNRFLKFLSRLMLAITVFTYIFSDVCAAESLGAFTSHKDPVTDVAIVPGSQVRAVSTSDRGDIICWDVASKRVIWQRELHGTSPECSSLKVSSSGRFLVPLRRGLAPKILFMGDGTTSHELKLPPDLAGAWWLNAVFSFDERLVALMSDRGDVVIYDTEMQAVIKRVNNQDHPEDEMNFGVLSFTKDGKKLIVLNKYKVAILDVMSSQVILAIPASDFGLVTNVTVFADLRLVAIDSMDALYIVATENLKILHKFNKKDARFEHGLLTQQLQFDGTNQSLHTWNVSMDSPWPGVYAVYDVVRGRQIEEKLINEPVFNPELTTQFFTVLAALAPSTRMLLSGNEDRRWISIWLL
jgi:WD40 repeat protein